MKIDKTKGIWDETNNVHYYDVIYQLYWNEYVKHPKNMLEISQDDIINSLEKKNPNAIMIGLHDYITEAKQIIRVDKINKIANICRQKANRNGDK